MSTISFRTQKSYHSVKIDPALIRPAEVDLLIGASSKANIKLGWKPEVSFEELAKMMVDSDLERLKRDRR